MKSAGEQAYRSCWQPATESTVLLLLTRTNIVTTSTNETQREKGKRRLTFVYHRMRQEHVEPSKKRSAPDSEVEKKEVRVDSIVSSPSLQTALELSWNDSSLGSGVSPLFFAIQGKDDVVFVFSSVSPTSVGCSATKHTSWRFARTHEKTQGR